MNWSATIYNIVAVIYQSLINGDARKCVAASAGTINTAVRNSAVKKMRRDLLGAASVISVVVSI